MTKHYPHEYRDDVVRVVRYSERLNEAEIVTSVESTGDSYDNALAESFNGLYKSETDSSPRSLAQRRARRMGHTQLRLLV
jgi:putative transposase